jgi:homoserine O-succinyltransferase
VSTRPLRVGIINLMPQLEAYEPLLVDPLTRVQRPIEPVLIRLATHAYAPSDHAHLALAYRTFDEVITHGPLDGLVISGMPVEELPFSGVPCWAELVKIMAYARAQIRSTLGVSWGGLALAATLKIPKLRYAQKLFGVYTHRILTESPLLADHADSFECAQSRHAGIADWELQAAEEEGRVRLLGHSIEAGYTLFETPDHAFVMHLGHPEYVAERLVFEHRRDQQLGRTDVPPPRNFDPDHPETSWESHREQLFDRWTQLLAR